MKNNQPTALRISALILAAGLCSFMPAANAANIIKANNANNLTVGTSWVGGVVPTSADVAVWDSTVTSANTVSLGASTNWAGLKIANPSGLVTVASDGFTFTNNASGIDMSTATANLTINSGLAIGANQTWNIANGRTLTLGSAATSLNGNTYNLTIFGAGTVQLTGGTGFLPPNAVVLLPTNSTINLGGNSQTLRSLTLVNANPASNYTATVTSGSLTITNSTDITANQNDVLDLSGLSAFTFAQPDYARTWRILPSTAFTGTTNTVLLAKSGANGGLNTFYANSVQIGGAAGTSANDNHMGTLRLGTTNVINAGTLQIGGFNGRGSVNFQNVLTAPILTVRGTNGATSRAVLVKVGETSSGVRAGDGLLDATGGSLDMATTNLWISRHIANANNNDTSTLTMPGGNLDLLNLILSFKEGTGTPTLTGTMNQQGGTATIQTLMMGTNSSTGAPIVKSTYNLSGGTLRAATIFAGPAPSGSFGAGSSRIINWTNGTIQNYDASTDLNVTGVTISAPGVGTRSFTVDSSRSIIITTNVTQVAAGASPITKAGSGTLDLQGTTDNAFLGLNISNGVVLLNKTSSGSVSALGADSTIAGGTLKLSGSGGNQIANTRSLQINSGSFDINGLAETIAGLGGSGGSVINSGASAVLTLSAPTGSNYVAGASLNNAFDLAKTGAGKQTLSGTDSRSSGVNTVTQGTLEIGNGGATGTLAGDTTVTAPGILAFNRTGTLNFAGNISGSGDVVQNGPGTLILSGSDTHTGNTLVNAGTLQLPVAATTIGGSVVTVAAGGTFDTAPGGGGFFIGAGQVLKGAGTVAGNYIIGSQGMLSGTLTNTGNVTGASTDSTNSPGGNLVAGTLRVNGSYVNGPATLVFDLASTTGIGGGTNDLLVVGGNLDISSACTLEIHQLGGSLAAGTYVLATYGTFSGSTANITVVGSPRYTYALSAVSGQLRLNITGNSANLAWRGDGVGNAWDQGVSSDWFNTGSASVDTFFNGDATTFDNVGSTNPAVDIQVSVSPASLTVNATSDYTFSGVGSIDGATGLTKSGTGTLTIGTVNGFSGSVTLNGGTVSVTNLAPAGSASGIGAGTSLNFNGGTLQYTGAALGIGGFSRNLNLGAGGGTIDQSSTSGIFLFVTNKITGVGSLTKAGAQQLILGDGTSGTGSNDYSGITYINAGNVQIRNAYALGSTAAKTIVYEGATLSADGSGSGFTNVILENIDLAAGTLQGAGGNANFGGNITLVSNSIVGGSSALTISGPIGGPGSLTKAGSGTVTILNSASTLTGGTINTAGTLQLGNGTVNGTLPGPINIQAGTLSALPATNTTIVLPGSISGSGQLLVNNLGGTLSLTGTNDWTGLVNVNAGSLWINDSTSLGVGPKNVQLFSGTAGQPSLYLNGTNGNITLPADIQLNCSWVSGVLFNQAGSNTVLGTIKLTSGGGDSLFVVNAGTLNLAGIISADVSNRGFRLGGAGTGIVSGVVDASWGFAPRELLMQGTGTWIVSSTNAVLIPANVNSGRLLLNGQWAGDANAQSGGTLGGTGNIIGNVSVATGGTLSPGASVGTLAIGGNFTNSGNLFIEVNKSLVQSNDYVSVVGSLTNTAAGTLTVSNLGPALVTGNRFVLFSQPLPNGNVLAVTGGGAGVTWTNNLAVDGSISVLSVASPVNTNTFAVGAVVSGSNLNLSWPPDRLGWKVQLQTNTLNVGLNTNWVTVPATATVTNYTIPLNPANPSVFIRMTYP